MFKITNKLLDDKLAQVNRMLDRPVDEYVKEDGAYKAQFGHIGLEHQNGWFAVSEITNDGGGLKRIADGLSRKDVYCFLTGMINGIHLNKTS